MAKKAEVINRYRFDANDRTFTFFAKGDDLLGVEIDGLNDLGLEGTFLTKSNDVIDEAIKQIHNYMVGESKTLSLPFTSKKQELNKKVKEALKEEK